MNDLVRFANSVEYTNGKKRGRPPKFNANQFYPFKEERRLQGALKKELATFIREAYEVAIVDETFTADSLEDLSELPERLSEEFKQEVNYAANSIAKNAYDNIANMTEMVVGKPYYPPAAKDELLKNWEANFNLLCKSAESDAKKDISRIVAQAENEGWGIKQLERAVMGELPSKYASRAKLIARTESAKLNSEVTLESFRETGCEYYTWMAAMDERTRPEHAMMHGLICSVNDPTVWYEENPDDPLHPIEHQRDDTMVHLHPGEDYQCRCTMVMWDPEIDGKYEIKERPEEEPSEEPEEKPENEPESRELEKANERLAEKEKELERAENERKTVEKELAQEKISRKAAEKAFAEKIAENETLKEEKEQAKRAIRLQKAAEKRHKRNQAKKEKIQERWNIHQVKRAGVIDTEYAAKDTVLIKDVSDVQTVINKYIEKFPGETEYSSIKIKTFKEPPTLNGYAAMSANHSSETISFNISKSSIFGDKPSAFSNLVSAFQKIQRGKELTFEEEYALECFYHEILHSKSKQYSVLNEHGKGDFKRTAMETVNQFVSRHDYADFIRNMGGRVYHQEEVLENGGGYRNWLKTLREFIKAKGIDENKTVSHFRDKLINGRYDELDSVLYDFFRKNSGTTRKIDEVLGEFEKCRKPDEFIKFLETKNNNPST